MFSFEAVSMVIFFVRKMGRKTTIFVQDMMSFSLLYCFWVRQVSPKNLFRNNTCQWLCGKDEFFFYPNLAVFLWVLST